MGTRGTYVPLKHPWLHHARLCCWLSAQQGLSLARQGQAQAGSPPIAPHSPPPTSKMRPSCSVTVMPLGPAGAAPPSMCFCSGEERGEVGLGWVGATEGWQKYTVYLSTRVRPQMDGAIQRQRCAGPCAPPRPTAGGPGHLKKDPRTPTPPASASLLPCRTAPVLRPRPRAH